MLQFYSNNALAGQLRLTLKHCASWALLSARSSVFSLKIVKKIKNNRLREAVVSICFVFVFEHFFYSSATPIIVMP